jgi:intracellular sulfur oxidation DsrE/DsrF family protein
VTNIKESGFSVVFHLDEIDKTEMAIKNILNLLADDSIDIAHVALVVNGDAIITLAGNSLWESDILRLIQKEVEIYACRNAMQSKGLVESRLIPGVVSVPSGVGRLVLLQANRYAYIRP